MDPLIIKKVSNFRIPPTQYALRPVILDSLSQGNHQNVVFHIVSHTMMTTHQNAQRRNHQKDLTSNRKRESKSNHIR